MLRDEDDITWMTYAGSAMRTAKPKGRRERDRQTDGWLPSSARRQDVSVCSAEFLFRYPHQCGCFGPEPTNRLGSVAACDLHREGRNSVEYNFVFHGVSIWHGACKNASLH